MRSPIYVMHLFKQCAVVIPKPDDVGLVTCGPPCAQQTFDQPGPKGVEPLDPAHIDRHAAGRQSPFGHCLNQRLKFVRMFGRPRARGSKRETLAGHRANEHRLCSHHLTPGFYCRSVDRVRGGGPGLIPSRAFLPRLQVVLDQL